MGKSVHFWRSGRACSRELQKNQSQIYHICLARKSVLSHQHLIFLTMEIGKKWAMLIDLHCLSASNHPVQVLIRLVSTQMASHLSDNT